MTFSGILIGIRIPFNKEKRGCVRHSQVFSTIFEYPSTKRNEDVYDILRYSHRHSNTLQQRETRMCTTFSGILITVRITYDKRNEVLQSILQVFSLWFESTFCKEKRRCAMVSSGILDTYEYIINLNTQEPKAKYLLCKYEMNLQL